MPLNKEKLPNALTSKKDLPPPNLIKNPAEKRRGRDTIDIEGEKFFNELQEDIEDLKTADNFIQILLRKRFIDIDKPVSSAREKINERMKELEKTLESLRGRFARNPEIKHNEIDDEFEQLSIEEKDNIETELERLEITYKVLGHFLRAGIIAESDIFIKATEAIFSQIKKFTPSPQ